MRFPIIMNYFFHPGRGEEADAITRNFAAAFRFFRCENKGRDGRVGPKDSIAEGGPIGKQGK